MCDAELQVLRRAWPPHDPCMWNSKTRNGNDAKMLAVPDEAKAAILRMQVAEQHRVSGGRAASRLNDHEPPEEVD